MAFSHIACAELTSFSALDQDKGAQMLDQDSYAYIGQTRRTVVLVHHLLDL